MHKLIYLISFSSVVLLSGCVNVEPWEREFLAKEHMLLEPNPLLTSFRQHAYFSREGTSGGLGEGAGGCGCN